MRQPLQSITTRPKISVVIASFNHQKYVRECLESVLSQAHADFDIVITDDCSTDGTVEQIKLFAGSRIDLRVLPHNVGQFVALNESITRARGMYLAVLNSDDYFLPDKLAQQTDYLDHNPDVAAVFTLPHLVGENGEPVREHLLKNLYEQATNVPRHQWLRRFFFGSNVLCHPTVMLRRSCHDRVGLYDPRLAQLADWDMWIRILREYDIHVLQEELVCFRIRENESNASALHRKDVRLRSSWEARRVLENFRGLDKTLFAQIFPEKSAECARQTTDELIAELALGIKSNQHITFALDTLHRLHEGSSDHTKYERLAKRAQSIDPFNVFRLSILEQQKLELQRLLDDPTVSTPSSSSATLCWIPIPAWKYQSPFPTAGSDVRTSAPEQDIVARVDALMHEGMALEESGEAPKAERKYLEALALYPEAAGVQICLGNLYFGQNQFNRAYTCFAEALKLKPGYAGAHYSLARVHIKRDEYEDAEWHLNTALEADSELTQALHPRALVQLNTGFVQEAIASLRKLTELDWTEPDYLGSLLFALNYSPDISGEDLIKEHLKYDDRFGSRVQGDSVQFPVSADPNKRIRIGYLSGDLRIHVVARFLEPVLRNHDKHCFEIYAYYNYDMADEVTNRLMGLCDVWRNVSRLTDDELLGVIRTDGIDVLVELAGHTHLHRMGVLARRAAPVQASWLGYLNTIGLRTIDYRICDRWTEPETEQSPLLPEQVARLPDCQWCLPLFGEIPPVNNLPMLANGYATFGSFNHMTKINDRVITLWSKILLAVAGSRLLMVGVPGQRAREGIVEKFATHGVSVDRLDIRPRISSQDYFLTMRTVDIALDTFPYNGGTTTFDALAMGLPVVTLASDRPAGRSGASILSNMGLSELIAYRSEDYVSIAASLARNVAQLRRMRAEMRRRLEQSPIAQTERFTRNLENLYRGWWQRKTRTLQAASRSA